MRRRENKMAGAKLQMHQRAGNFIFLRDEVYFVTRGKRFFFDGERRHSVGPGSFLLVPAGQIHRFEDFSSNFTVWAVFYGPEGGERDD